MFCWGVGGSPNGLRGRRLPCGTPYELHGSAGRVVKEHDLSNSQVVDDLVDLCKRGGYKFVHLGTPCGSFSILDNLNGGTRSSERPEGDLSQAREVLGNILAISTVRICEAQMSAGNWFSVENPATSWLWRLDAMVE